MPAPYKLTWLGDVMVARAARAIGKGMIGIGERVVVNAQMNAHVVTNTLRPSIHLAVPNSSGDQRADTMNIMTTDGAALEAGSWLDYACVEEVGRGHAFMGPAVEEVAGPVAEDVMGAAFRSEGLIAG
jgi:hypothetical protein